MKKGSKDYQEYLKLMTVIHVYSRFEKEFEAMHDGYDDEETSLEILEDVENSFLRVKEIQDEKLRQVAESLKEEMEEMLKTLAGEENEVSE